MALYCSNCFHPLSAEERICPRCGYDPEKNTGPPFALSPGSWLHSGKYLVGRVLGQGGFGITYAGYDLALEMKVAIKEYYPVHMASRSQTGSSLQWHGTSAEKESGKESFVREARKMAKVHSIPNVVEVREVFFENDTAYIIMDFLEGETLRDRLLKTGPMSYIEVSAPCAR
ncbi:MAG: protein kinase [Oscillospiraceae bacterium]|nr:protein kinase [Oscillospiraceae bacterium]